MRKAQYDLAREIRDDMENQVKTGQEQWDLLYGDHKPYELLWWESPDCGSEIDSLATQVPFDYRERHQWNADRTEVEHFLDMAHPMLGRRRPDLRFAVGENVYVVPQPVHISDVLRRQHPNTSEPA